MSLKTIRVVTNAKLKRTSTRWKRLKKHNNMEILLGAGNYDWDISKKFGWQCINVKVTIEEV